MTNTPAPNQSPSSYRDSQRSGKQREAALVVLHADGWVEVYGQRHLDVHIATMPYMTSTEGEQAAEAFLESTLPRRYRVLFWPDLRRAADTVRVVRPNDIVLRDWEMELLESLDRLGDHGRERRLVWTL